MSVRRYIAVFALCASASAYAQQSVDVDVSHNMARLAYTSPSLGDMGMEEGHWDATLLFTDNDINYMAALGFKLMGDTGSGSPGLSAGLGLRGYWVDTDRGDIAALTLGGQVHYAPPSLPRLKLEADLNYAPDITTFKDGSSFVDSRAYVGYEVARGSVFDIGYRYLNIDMNHGAGISDQGAFLGIILSF